MDMGGMRIGKDGGREHPTGDPPLPLRRAAPAAACTPSLARSRPLAPRLLAAALLPCARPSSFPLPRLLTAALLLLPLHCCCRCSCCCCYCRAYAVLVLARSRSLAGAVAAAAVVAAAACALTGPHPLRSCSFLFCCGTTSACKTKISFKDCI